MSVFAARSRLRSLRHALRGAATLVRTQPNAQWHSLATAVVTGAGVFFGIAKTDWALVILAIALVWITESLNTALEFLADEVSKDRRELIKQAKDVAAFSVLVAALASVAIGIVVFAPYFSRWP